MRTIDPLRLRHLAQIRLWTLCMNPEGTSMSYLGEDGWGIRMLNKRNEFLWVHEKFASEY